MAESKCPKSYNYPTVFPANFLGENSVPGQDGPHNTQSARIKETKLWLQVSRRSKMKLLC
jgi:hypothetical protein